MAKHSYTMPTGSLYGRGNPIANIHIDLADDERPVSISFTGRAANEYQGGDSAFQMALCDTSGGNAHNLKSMGVDRGGEAIDPTTGKAHWVDGSNPIDCNTSANPASAWANLRGANLALKKIQSDYTYDGLYVPVTATVTTSIHTITWTSPSLSISQNEYVLTVAKGGSATDNWDGAVAYDLHMDGTYVGTFSGNSLAVTLRDDQLEIAHTFTLYAVSSAGGHTAVKVGATASFTPKSVHKTMKYRTGGAWVECYANVRVGSTWVEVEPFYYDGTSWVPCSQT